MPDHIRQIISIRSVVDHGCRGVDHNDLSSISLQESAILLHVVRRTVEDAVEEAVVAAARAGAY